ncbi:NTP transferase domain-containing protein, partial [Bacteroides fragilis]|nr:NTP transferase domain-containing protein [Bacteroides fragilis]
MKAVILAGGFGTRLSEATNLIPKPMVEIGGKPILWHIMKTYSHYGINEFIICCGYKQYIIKEYFANYFRHNSDMMVDLSNNTTTILDNHSENWKVTMVDTGLNTMTGGRIKRVQKYIGNERFLLTYGDGVADLNITDTIQSH